MRWSTLSMLSRSSSRVDLVVTGGILHINPRVTSLHHRLAARQDLHFQHVAGAELLTGGAANRDPPVIRPLPACLCIIGQELSIEVHVDEVGVGRLVIEGN